MLQSSETTKAQLELLNYPNQKFENNYYTAVIRPGVGVAIARMLDGFMVQLFPWTDACPGHEAYARFIGAKATSALAENNELFYKWPFRHFKDDNMLLIKCAVEDAINQMEVYDADNKRSNSNPPAGEAVE